MIVIARSAGDEAIHACFPAPWIASLALAMTSGLLRRPREQRQIAVRAFHDESPRPCCCSNCENRACSLIFDKERLDLLRFLDLEQHPRAVLAPYATPHGRSVR